MLCEYWLQNLFDILVTYKIKKPHVRDAAVFAVKVQIKNLYKARTSDISCNAKLRLFTISFKSLFNHGNKNADAKDANNYAHHLQN